MIIVYSRDSFGTGGTTGATWDVFCGDGEEGVVSVLDQHILTSPLKEQVTMLESLNSTSMFTERRFNAWIFKILLPWSLKEYVTMHII